MLEKHLSGYDESAHVPSRQDAASKLAPASPSSEATVDKVCAGLQSGEAASGSHGFVPLAFAT